MLRSTNAVTTYKRLDAENPVMRAIEPDMVLEALEDILRARASRRSA